MEQKKLDEIEKQVSACNYGENKDLEDRYRQLLIEDEELRESSLSEEEKDKHIQRLFIESLIKRS